MPVVPFADRRSQANRQAPAIDQTYLLMAAADLHQAGRLFEPSQATATKPIPEIDPKDAA